MHKFYFNSSLWNSHCFVDHWVVCLFFKKAIIAAVSDSCCFTIGQDICESRH